MRLRNLGKENNDLVSLSEGNKLFLFSDCAFRVNASYINSDIALDSASFFQPAFVVEGRTRRQAHGRCLFPAITRGHLARLHFSPVFFGSRPARR